MDKCYLFLISGYSGVGKDTFADQFINKYSSVKFGITDTPRRQMMSIFGFSEIQMFGASSHRNIGDLRFPKALFHKWNLIKFNQSTASSWGMEYEEDMWFTVGWYDEFKEDIKLWKGVHKFPIIGNENLFPNYGPILIGEGNPNFWLSPREVLQKQCACTQDMYEDVWINDSIQSQSSWIKNNYKLPNKFTRNDQTYTQSKGFIQSSIIWKDKCSIICSDIRHKHEINYVHKHMNSLNYIPVVIRIKRPGIENPPYDHRSETEQSSIPDESFDFVINNDSDTSHLSYIADEIMSIIDSGNYQPKKELV